jgi:hypothetical protein
MHQHEPSRCSSIGTMDLLFLSLSFFFSSINA